MSKARVENLIQRQCFWIHNALTTEEQIKVFKDLLERSKNTDNSSKPCMNPSPKTLIFDGRTPTLRFGKSRNNKNDNDNKKNAPLPSVYYEFIVQKALSLVSPQFDDESNSHNTQNGVLHPRCQCDRYSVAVIRYKAPNDKFTEHVDHCNDTNGWVVLLSLGCTARFTIKGPSDTTTKTIQLCSGDILLFNPSSQAAIKHGVASIISSSCPNVLVEAFGESTMANYRYGVQCRTSLQNSV